MEEMNWEKLSSEQRLRTQGICDLHIHSAPDLRQRKLNDLQLMEASIKMGVRAIVLKSHHVPTVDRATLANLIKQEKYGDAANFTMFGGIVINLFEGGVNPWGVETALKLGGKVVWMPTISAENQACKENRSNFVRIVENGKIVPQLKPVLELIRDHDAILATGHISPEECFIVTEAARSLGVKKIVITHPEFHIVGMSLEDQKRIVKDYDVMLERVYAQPLPSKVYYKNVPDNIAAMKEIGSEHFIVSTDGGQMQNPAWYNTIVEYINALYDAGFTKEEIDTMTKYNAGRMLGVY